MNRFLFPGATCSKLTMSLVNNSLKFQMAILQIHCYFFLLKKCENALQRMFAMHCKERILTIFFQQKITVYLLLKSIYI